MPSESRSGHRPRCDRVLSPSMPRKACRLYTDNGERPNACRSETPPTLVAEAAREDADAAIARVSNPAWAARDPGGPPRARRWRTRAGPKRLRTPPGASMWRRRRCFALRRTPLRDVHFARIRRHCDFVPAEAAGDAGRQGDAGLRPTRAASVLRQMPPPPEVLKSSRVVAISVSALSPDEDHAVGRKGRQPPTSAMIRRRSWRR